MQHAKCLQLPSADDVEYWRSPDKAGWLQSQGEVMKTWRKRWFVLKQGYLFRCVWLHDDTHGSHIGQQPSWCCSAIKRSHAQVI